jgi:hypothetical protein
MEEEHCSWIVSEHVLQGAEVKWWGSIAFSEVFKKKLFVYRTTVFIPKRQMSGNHFMQKEGTKLEYSQRCENNSLTDKAY